MDRMASRFLGSYGSFVYWVLTVYISTLKAPLSSLTDLSLIKLLSEPLNFGSITVTVSRCCFWTISLCCLSTL